MAGQRLQERFHRQAVEVGANVHGCRQSHHRALHLHEQRAGAARQGSLPAAGRSAVFALVHTLAELWNSELGNSDVRNPHLWDTELGNTDLRNTHFWDTDLRHSDVRNANLWDAHLRNTVRPDDDERSGVGAHEHAEHGGHHACRGRDQRSVHPHHHHLRCLRGRDRGQGHGGQGRRQEGRCEEEHFVRIRPRR
ncbi:pentapeptide repeat-containing protein [Nocardia sp. NBC_01377]|uniref:pentapeptide repeat-containing protein n=1 Tax=Nocardia sp. NBC_01377 TaxID=2903595 RepID=UPI00386A8721